MGKNKNKSKNTANTKSDSAVPPTATETTNNTPSTNAEATLQTACSASAPAAVPEHVPVPVAEKYAPIENPAKITTDKIEKNLGQVSQGENTAKVNSLVENPNESTQSKGNKKKNKKIPPVSVPAPKPKAGEAEVTVQGPVQVEFSTSKQAPAAEKVETLVGQGQGQGLELKSSPVASEPAFEENPWQVAKGKSKKNSPKTSQAQVAPAPLPILGQDSDDQNKKTSAAPLLPQEREAKLEQSPNEIQVKASQEASQNHIQVSPDKSNELADKIHLKESQESKKPAPAPTPASIRKPGPPPKSKLIKSLNDGSAETKAKQIFIHSLCHTCKQVGVTSGQSESESESSQKIEPLLRCGRCRMVSYCCKDHQVQDWEAHKEFCLVIKKTLKNEKKKFLYEGSTKYALKKEPKWLKVRQNYLTSFASELKRELEDYEKEMLMFPPMCFTCAERPLSQLTPCTKCQCVSFCPDHLTQDKTHAHCQELKLWVESVRFEHDYGLIRPQFNPRTTLRLDETNSNLLGDGIYSFIGPFGGNNALIVATTDVATVPLTILWTLNNEAAQWHPKETLLVHVIGAEMKFEGNCPTKWETFLFHLLPPQVLKLKIILIGSNLSHCPTPTINLGLCNFCKGKKCEVCIIHAPGLAYHEYIHEQGLNFVPPDVICAFNCKAYEKSGTDTWGPTIPCLRKGGIIATTAHTQKEAKDDCDRILKECPTLMPKVREAINPFRSLRPQRTFIKGNEEYLIHKNQYINIFI